MSSTPGALEIVRYAFDRIRTAVPVAPPTRKERAAAWERMSQSLAGWSVPTDDAAITGFDPAKPGSEQSFVFRTKLPEATWRELAPPPAVEIEYRVVGLASTTPSTSEAQAMLNQMGQAGWQLVHGTPGALFFKRRLIP